MPAKDLWHNNKTFFIPVITTVIIGIVFLGLYSKEAIHLTQNQWYHPFWDSFFRYGTYLGDGLFYIVPALLLPFFKFRYLLGLIANALLVLILVALFKQLVFTEQPRPARFFEDLGVELHLVEGVVTHSNNSFPSGHTTTGFAIFGYLALLWRRPSWQVLCFVIAAMVGYSRIYLSQHFLQDVVAGALLGTIIAIISFWLMQRPNGKWADKHL